MIVKKTTIIIAFIGLILIISGLIVMTINDKKQIQEYKTKNIQLQNDNVRYKMMYEEAYELFITCQETNTWYEDFYYDNVDSYTGEIYGEYYE